ncbi:unnamed protein product [Ambrosiozyma monospora]|uniref:Unnamed protein product n=1 Tax=Ambrosiozyma monospora TaxID=43982 RepID=A0ACB5TE20_AMBMO|nr:unnamed protein product [Ambrosiozyma monospora]
MLTSSATPIPITIPAAAHAHDDYDYHNETIHCKYPRPVEQIRKESYPHMADNVYLDHAGMTIYSKELVLASSEMLLKNLFGNSHSHSGPSTRSENVTQKTRNQVLQMFSADPKVFDVAFTLNATHAIKTVGLCFKDCFDDFDYFYNLNCHTSVVGVRELASKSTSFNDMDDLNLESDKQCLISWTGQSNLNGERYPINEWNKEIKDRSPTSYTLLDAASLSTTAPPDLSDHETFPDFMAVSFYKMFGMPDIGGLIFKKEAAKKILPHKKYFGGGTVDAVALDIPYKEFKDDLYSIVEEGTLPIHSIVQLSEAIRIHNSIYGSYKNISSYVKELTQYAIRRLQSLTYKSTGAPMVVIHSPNLPNQGPIIAFSLRNSKNEAIGYFDFEESVSLGGLSVRSGGMCNVGGIQKWLGRDTNDIIRDYNAGHTCGGAMDIVDGKPTGLLRVSFGAMSLKEEVDTLVDRIVDFLKNY